MTDGVFDSAGHFELWDAHAQEPSAATAEAILDKMAVDGFNATTDMPACFLYEELMARYPEARVVLSVRSSGTCLRYYYSMI